MATRLIDTIAPHYCYSCGRIGAVLCEYCKYDIVSEPFERCIICLKPQTKRGNLCVTCKMPYSRAWCVGDRANALKLVIDTYKYESTRAVSITFADLLNNILPHLPPDTRVVGIPTASDHVRIRGFDHMAVLARRFAKKRGLVAVAPLERITNEHQYGSGRRARIAQAKRAFRCQEVDFVPHLLIDDVYTTGSTLRYASMALLEAGASEVYVAVLSRQPLEK